jgi:hypothetical protein
MDSVLSPTSVSSLATARIRDDEASNPLPNHGGEAYPLLPSVLLVCAYRCKSRLPQCHVGVWDCTANIEIWLNITPRSEHRSSFFKELLSSEGEEHKRA